MDPLVSPFLRREKEAFEGLENPLPGVYQLLNGRDGFQAAVES